MLKSEKLVIRTSYLNNVSETQVNRKTGNASIYFQEVKLSTDNKQRAMIYMQLMTWAGHSVTITIITVA